MIGFPGKTFYEFDLSGEFVAKNTATTATAQLDKQTISFVSDAGITIGVSDDELEEVTKNGYSFMPNYMSKKVEGYLMNTVGDCFDKTPKVDRLLYHSVRTSLRIRHRAQEVPPVLSTSIWTTAALTMMMTSKSLLRMS